MTVTAITGATLLDGTGGAPIDDAVVLIDGQRIRATGRAADVPVPEGAAVVDARGRHVIPGLMDANAHLCNSLPDTLIRYHGRLEELIEEASQVALRAGVTTVFDTWGPLRQLLAVRDRIARGEVPGCRSFVGGNIIGLDGPLSPDFFPPGELLAPSTREAVNADWVHGVGADLLWLTPDGVRERVRAYAETSGADFLKYASNSHMGAAIAFSAPAQRAIVEEAHRLGMTAQAHTISVEGLRMEIEAGADILQHGNITGNVPIPDETIASIVDGGIAVAALVPTTRYLDWIARHGHEWHRTVGFTATTDLNNRRLIEAGARLLLTVDGFVGPPKALEHPYFGMAGAVAYSQHLGEGHFLWLEAVIERGMDPMEALLSGTRYVAEAYGQAADIGTIEPGKRADLVVLGGDPLADVQNYRRIEAVMKDGAFADLDALPVHPVVTAEEE
jgi:imidazolonepropionase-like amidohydrolase